MISIHSLAEDEFVANWANNWLGFDSGVWWGGTRKNKTEEFRWLDKSLFNYSKWRYNLMVRAGMLKRENWQWVSVYCYMDNYVICQKTF